MSDFVLNYRVDGNGPPLLLVHGFGISFNIWESIIPFLLPYFMLIIVELPGIGRSPMPECEKPYLDQAATGFENIRILLEIDQWQILSYSSGTRAAERYLQLYPSSVERAFFLCPAQVSASKALGLSAAIHLDRLFPRFGDWVLSGSRLKFLIDLLGFNLKKNNLSAKWFVEISSQPVEVLKETLRSLLIKNGRSFSVPKDKPVYFIWSYDDLIVDAPRSFSPLKDYGIRANHSAPQTAAQQVSDLLLFLLLSNMGKQK